jgi:hypothetical protein
MRGELEIGLRKVRADARESLEGLQDVAASVRRLESALDRVTRAVGLHEGVSTTQTEDTKFARAGADPPAARRAGSSSPIDEVKYLAAKKHDRFVLGLFPLEIDSQKWWLAGEHEIGWDGEKARSDRDNCWSSRRDTRWQRRGGSEAAQGEAQAGSGDRSAQSNPRDHFAQGEVARICVWNMPT